MGEGQGDILIWKIYIPLSRSSQDSEVQGVIPRAVKDIFNYIRENKSTEYLVKVMSQGFLSGLNFLRCFVIYDDLYLPTFRVMQVCMV